MSILFCLLPRETIGEQANLQPTMEILLTPVASHPDGDYGHGGAYSDADIFGQELRIRQGGFNAFFNVQLKDWDPDCQRRVYESCDVGLRSWQARIRSADLLGASAIPSNAGLDLTWADVACGVSSDCTSLLGEPAPSCRSDRCDWGWITRCRDDNWFGWCACDICECGMVWDVGRANPVGPLFFGTADPWGGCRTIDDRHIPYYAGSLTIHIPENARGRYTIGFVAEQTVAHDDTQPVAREIPLAALTPAVVNIIGDDCNNNAQHDEADILLGVSQDVNANGFPDECEDCQPNGIVDEDDLADGTSLDCNSNDLPDECDIAACSGDPACADCDANGVPDSCDVASCPEQDPFCGDCNGNQILDGCEVRDGTLADFDGDGRPDFCPSIPTASAWGLAILTLSLLVAAKLRFHRHTVA